MGAALSKPSGLEQRFSAPASRGRPDMKKGADPKAGSHIPVVGARRRSGELPTYQPEPGP